MCALASSPRNCAADCSVTWLTQMSRMSVAHGPLASVVAGEQQGDRGDGRTGRAVRGDLRGLPRRRIDRRVQRVPRPAYRDEFAAWRGAYSNPFRDLQGDSRTRNWDSERRFADLEADGQVAEVIFPNTVPPFFPTGMLVARPPLTRDGARPALGRAARAQPLAGRLVRRAPRTAAPASPRCSSTTSTAPSRRCGGRSTTACAAASSSRRSPTTPTSSRSTPGYYDPLWQTCQDLDVIINHHSGSGHPNYGEHTASQFMWAIETEWYAHRPFWQLVMSGVFERYPTPAVRAHRAGLRVAAVELDDARRHAHGRVDGPHGRAQDGPRGQPLDARRASTSSATCGSGCRSPDPARPGP